MHPIDVEAQLNQLRQEIASLRREQGTPFWKRHGTWFGWLVCLLLGCLMGRLGLEKTSAQTDDSPVFPLRDAIFRSVKIVDADGKPRLQLGGKDDPGQIVLLRPDGKPQLLLNVNANGGVLVLGASDARPRVVLEVSKDGQGTLALHNKDAVTNFFAGGSPEGGLLRIYDGAAREHVFLGVFRKDQGGLLSLNDAGGKPRLLLASDQTGGVINLFGKSNKRQAFFGSSKEAGSGLHLYDPEGKLAIVMEASKKVGEKSIDGFLSLGNADGKERLLLGVDKNGTGFVERRDQQEALKGSFK